MSRSSALAKLAAGLRLIAQAEAELREAEPEPSDERHATKPVVTELDRARARRALDRRGFKR